MEKNEELRFRPYARLLTMLGDQLIKDEKIALSEIIKNAYDADATFCLIDLKNFGSNFEISAASSILISDDGCGMDFEILSKHFMNPATSFKENKNGILSRSPNGRVRQGEKGIGRFAMLKLGAKIEILTKVATETLVHRLVLDFSGFDKNYNNSQNPDEDLFLDQLSAKYSSSIFSLHTEFPDETSSGTYISISFLKGTWDDKKIKSLQKEFDELLNLDIDDNLKETITGFRVMFYKNNLPIDDVKRLSLKDVVNNKAVIKIRNGHFDEASGLLTFSIQNCEDNPLDESVLYALESTVAQKEITSLSKALYGLTNYRVSVNEISNILTEKCGNFDFQFFVFDLSAKATEPFGLTQDEVDFVRPYRTYLYRDGVRVQPYGSVNDDWLGIDKQRAQERAGLYFSNDQLVGQVKISRGANPGLRDKTNREGLIESDKSFEKLTFVLRTFLSLIRVFYYQKYSLEKKKHKMIAISNPHESIDILDQLENDYRSNETFVRKISKAKAAIASQQNSYDVRFEKLERLAGVGLSVEMASHDLSILMYKLQEQFETLSQSFNDGVIQKEISVFYKEKLQLCEETLELFATKFNGLQSLFTSNKQRSRVSNIIPLIHKIADIYSTQYEKNRIKVAFSGSTEFYAKTIDAVIYQVFINLFDNSLYWLKTYPSKEGRKVLIFVDKEANTITFSDNGPGIENDNKPYIFEAFFTTKGDDGKGLGLYIARSLLGRYGYSISLSDSNTFESGASFVVDFSPKKEN